MSWVKRVPCVTYHDGDSGTKKTKMAPMAGKAVEMAATVRQWQKVPRTKTKRTPAL